MKKRVSSILAATLTLGLLAGCSPAGASNTQANATSAGGSTTAQSEWPKGNINLIVTHSPGGDTDYNARLMGRLLEEKLGVTVVVNNVTGSNGAIALTQYKDEKPDGQTFVFTNTAALTGNQATGISEFGYEAFEPVAIYGKQSGENIVVPADSPYNTLGDLVQASKDNPGTIKFGISTGGGVYIASVIMEHAGGTKFQVIESGDAAERVTSLLGGHVDATIAPYATIKEYIENGDMKALSTLLSEPPTMIPDVPAATETIPELKLNTYYVALAPKGTDAAIVEQLNAAILDIVNNNAEYKTEVNGYNLQDPWALNVADTKTELEAQKQLFMQYAEYLQ